MDGLAYIGENYVIGSAFQRARHANVADVNGDGKSDLLIRNDYRWRRDRRHHERIDECAAGPVCWSTSLVDIAARRALGLNGPMHKKRRLRAPLLFLALTAGRSAAQDGVAHP
jgi:hypothetical protein